MSKKINLFVLVLVMVLGFFHTVSADATIHLDIETNTGSLYNQDITVTPCDSDNAGTMSVTAYCAVLQSGVASDWSWYGTDAFVNSVGGVVNDYTNNIYWGWFHDLVYGDTAMSAHTLTGGERILLTFNINPLKLTVSDSDPTQHTTETITLSKFGLDSNFNPVWTGATGGSITINDTSYSVESDGTYLAVMDLMAPYVISGSKTGFINSNSITLNPTRPTSGGGGGGAISSPSVSVSIPVIEEKITEEKKEEEKKTGFDNKKSFEYLISQQKEDGSFGESIYTDWATLALTTGDNQDEVLKLVKYFSEFKDIGEHLTDYERHTMALMALGLNPYGVNGVNYIEKIVMSFDGKQFGDINEDNDDVFALIVLQNAGYTKDDKIISDDINFILSAQKEDGSWDGSVDMTGATIEALANFSSILEVRESLVKAKEFLKQNQKDDGGWGNVSATSWALQGILALGEKIEDWMKNEKTPLDYLFLNQDTDGGMKNLSASGEAGENVNNKIWETSYTLTSLSGKTWNQIMQKFDKKEIVTIEDKILIANKDIEKKVSEVKKIETKKIVKNIENISIQNTANIITAVENTEKIQIQKPVKNKSWISRFFSAIFSF